MILEMMKAISASATSTPTAPTTRTFCMRASMGSASHRRALARRSGDDLADVHAERGVDLLEQTTHGRRVGGGVRRDGLAITAVDQVDLADLHALRRLGDLAEDALEVLEHEHVHRLAAAVLPGPGDLGE